MNPSDESRAMKAMDKSPEAFRTISEVADELDLPQHVLRFWEGRFSQIKPLKRGGGRRYYRPDDVLLLRGIKHLLYGQGYTIKGVQRILKEQGLRHVMAIWQDLDNLPPQEYRSKAEALGAEKIVPSFQRADLDQDVPRGTDRIEPLFEPAIPPLRKTEADDGLPRLGDREDGVISAVSPQEPSQGFVFSFTTPPPVRPAPLPLSQPQDGQVARNSGSPKQGDRAKSRQRLEGVLRDLLECRRILEPR